jgi:arsenite-transporting ATPase
VPDFVEASLRKIVNLRKKLSSASSAVRGLFGAGGKQEEAVDKLEAVQASIRMVKDLFHDQKNTEFVIGAMVLGLGCG